MSAEPLPPQLRQLIDAEPNARVPPEVEARLLGRLDASLDLAFADAPPLPSPAAALTKLGVGATLFLTGVLTGVVLHAQLASSPSRLGGPPPVAPSRVEGPPVAPRGLAEIALSSRPVSPSGVEGLFCSRNSHLYKTASTPLGQNGVSVPISINPASRVEGPPVIPSSVEAPPPTPVVAREPAQVQPVVKKPSPPPPEETGLERERRLLEPARTAITRGMAAQAMPLLEQHAREFPDGALAEEREALWVQALAVSGAMAAARERARSFTSRFPDSLFLPVVERAVRGD